MNKRLKRILLCAIMFVILIIIEKKCDATSINITPSNPKVGDTVTITVTVPNVHTVTATANVSGAVSGTIKLVNGDIGGDAKSYSASAQYKCEKEGIINVSISSDSRAVLNGEDVNVGASASANVSGASASTTTDTNSNTSTNTKSKVATLANLGIKPNDFSGFKANKTSYSVEVPNTTEKIEIYATKGQSGQKITGTGTKTLKEGANAFNVVVTAEDGKTQKTYTINVTRKAENDKNNTTEENKIEENVNENQNTEESEQPLFGLSELSIAGLQLTPSFQSDVYEYKVELTEDIDKLDITALATSEDETIDITGNENLQEGENIITILVKGEKEEDTVAYQIIVNKVLNNGSEEDNNKQKNIIIGAIAAGIVLIVIILITVIIKKRNRVDGYFPYDEDDTLDDYEDNEDSENHINNNYNNGQRYSIDDMFEEKEDEYEQIINKKRHSKGKRFK